MPLASLPHPRSPLSPLPTPQLLCRRKDVHTRRWPLLPQGGGHSSSSLPACPTTPNAFSHGSAQAPAHCPARDDPVPDAACPKAVPAQTPLSPMPGRGPAMPSSKPGKGETIAFRTGSRPAHRVPKPFGFGTFLLPQSPVSTLRKAIFGPFFCSKGYTLLAYTLYPFAQNTTAPSNDHPPVCGPIGYTLSAKTLLPLFSTCPLARGQKGLFRAPSSAPFAASLRLQMGCTATAFGSERGSPWAGSIPSDRILWRGCPGQAPQSWASKVGHGALHR